MTSPSEQNISNSSLNHGINETISETHVNININSVDLVSQHPLKKKEISMIFEAIKGGLQFLILLNIGLVAFFSLFITTRKAHAASLDLVTHTVTNMQSPNEFAALSVQNRYPPLSPVTVSQASNRSVTTSNSYPSAFQTQCIIRLQDHLVKQRRSVAIYQPSFQGSRRNLLETKKQPSVVDRSSIILENDFAFTSFKSKTRRLVVKGRKRRPVIRCTGFKNLQHRRNPSLSSYLNRTKRMPLRKSLPYRPRSRSVLACSSNNDEKQSLFNHEKERRIQIQDAIKRHRIQLYIAANIIIAAQNSSPGVSLPFLSRIVHHFAKKISIENLATIAPVVDMTVNFLKSIHEVNENKVKENKSTLTVTDKTKMDYINRVKGRESRNIAAIVNDSSLQNIIEEAKLKDIERVGLGKDGVINCFKAVQDIWDTEDTRMIIAAYEKGKAQSLFNRIAATRYLSLWNPDYPIQAASCRFKQRMLERSALFTDQIGCKLRLIMDLEESSPDSEAKRISSLKLRLFSHALPSLGAQISTKEESFPSENNDAFWKHHEQELITMSFHEARKHYEEQTESKVLENDLQECIKGFLDADLL